MRASSKRGRRPSRWPLVAALAVSATLVAVADGARGGALDRSFDGDGVVTTELGTSAWAADVLVQRDGKIVAAGFSNDTERRNEGGFAVVRYRADGALDETFAGGRAVTPLGRIAYASAVALQPDGKVVAAGTVNQSAGRIDFALARYGSDGRLDSSFGSGGTVRTDFATTGDPFTSPTAESAADVLAQPDGKIVAVGRAVEYRRSRLLGSFALARYTAAGTLDVSFGGDGKVVTDFGGDAGAEAAALQPDGKIIAAGWVLDDSGQNSRVALARYLPDGSLDPSFDGDGRVVTDLATIEERATGIGLDSMGRIVVAVGAGGDLAVARYVPAGTLDATFGRDGVGHIGSDSPEVPSDLVIQRNGKIVVLGTGIADFVLARFLPNGRPDPGFGSAGVVITDLGGQDRGQAVALQPDGKLVGAGESRVGTTVKFALARYTPGSCSVPRLRGTTTAAARSRLAAANCRLGRVRRAFSKRVRRGRVVSQSPRAGREARDWARVDVVVSRGRRQVIWKRVR
jgi:uncharacterized delta-60 repeat protein